MPFKSEKQRRWMFANKPEMAKRWASEYKAQGGPLADFDAWTDVAPEQQTHEAAMNALLDMTPVVGDVKAFSEAETPAEYGLAVAGLVPGLGDLAPAAKPLLGFTPLFGKHIPSNTAKIAADPKMHSGDHRPDLSMQEKLDAAADAEYLMNQGRVGSQGDRLWKGIDTAQGKRDFLQYERPQGDHVYFMADKGKVRQIPAGKVPFEELGDEADTIATWRGRDDIPGQIRRTEPVSLAAVSGDEKARRAAEQKFNTLKKKMKKGPLSEKQEEELLELSIEHGFEFSKGGRVGPLGRCK